MQASNINLIISNLNKLQIKIEVVDDKLKITHGKGKLTKELYNIIKANKEQLLERFKRNDILIRSSEKKQYYDLSWIQKSIFSIVKLNVNSTSYNMPIFFFVNGEIDKSKLEIVLNKLSFIHNTLRTSFKIINDFPVQIINDSIKIEVNEYKIQESQLADLISQFVTPFDITIAPLFRVGLANIESKKQLLLFDMHHLISDGKSINIFFYDLLTLYFDGKINKTLQYIDYCMFESSNKFKSNLLKNKNFWIERFGHTITCLQLPYDKIKPSLQCFEGNVISFEYDIEKINKLKNIAAQSGTTLYYIFLSIFSVFLSKICTNNKIILGTNIEGRDISKLDKVMGMFVKTVPLNYTLDNSLTLLSLIQKIRVNTIAYLEKSNFPIQELIKELKLPRENNYNPIFNVLYSFQDIENLTFTNEEVTITPYFWQNNISKFDLSLKVLSVKNSIQVSFEYCTKLFHESSINNFVNYFNSITNCLLNNINATVSDIDIVSKEERTKILHAFNSTSKDYPKNKTIIDFFDDQLSNNPNKVAISYQDNSITFKDLGFRVNQLARVLRDKGVGNDVIVGVLLERSIELMIGILSIIKAGGVYMPLDIKIPKEKLNLILKDSEAKLVLNNKVQNCNVECINIKKQISQLPLNIDSLKNKNAPHESVYLIYTSGSTGKPKGVLIRNRSLINRLNWMQKEYTLDSKDVLIQKTPITFDVSVWELFLWILSGSKLHIPLYNSEKNPHDIYEAVVKHHISIIHFVPSMLSLFLDYVKENLNISKLKNLKQVISSGEELKYEHVISFKNTLFRNNTKLSNLYGPTEATIDVSYYNVNFHKIPEVIPIGKPIDNTSLFILDNYGCITPIGLPGELYIGGDNLAKAYLKDENLNKERFIEDHSQVNQRIYKTGDLAKWLPDGNIVFLGRIDEQVKIRGYRIELGEIETIILSHTEIKETVVLMKEDAENGKYLCAYIVANEDLSIESLKLQLSQYLPEYMIPSQFIRISKIPLTPNGKANKRRLLEINEREQSNKENIEIPAELKKKLTNIWKNILGKQVINENDNFFMLGGDSIKAIQLISMLQKEGYNLPTEFLYKYPYISKLHGYITRNVNEIEQNIVEGVIPLTSIQKDFFCDFKKDRNHYCQSVLLSFSEQIDHIILKKIFLKIQEHHDVLRITFNIDGKKIAQKNHGLDLALSLDIIDLRSKMNSKEIDIRIEAEILNIQKNIDIENGPLMRLGLFHLENEDRLLIAIHHLIIDGLSWRILLEDISLLYTQFKNNQPIRLQQKTHSFKKWSIELDRYSKNNKFGKEKKYWTQIICEKYTPLKKDFTNNSNLVKDCEKELIVLNEDLTSLLLFKSHSIYGCSIEELLITTLSLAINKTFKVSKVKLYLESHGRSENLNLNVTRTLGWFTSIFPIILLVKNQYDLLRQIKETKEILRRVPNKGIGYGLVKEDRSFSEYIEEKPQLLFNYLGQFDSNIENKNFKLITKKFGKNESDFHERKYEIEIQIINSEDKLFCHFNYSKNLYKKSTIISLVKNFNNTILNIIEQRHNAAQNYSTPSDYSFKNLTIDEIDLLESRYEIEDIFSLTPIQEGMLFYSLLNKNSDVNFEQISFRLNGILNKNLVNDALNILAVRYDVFRKIFIYEYISNPIQLILKQKDLNFIWKDIRYLASIEDKDSYIQEYKKNDRKSVFQLNQKSLLRIVFIQITEHEFEILWSFHHILLDGWSVGIIISDFFSIINNKKYTENFELPKVIPYKKYYDWLNNQDYDLSKSFWREYLNGFEKRIGFSQKFGLNPSNKEITKKEFHFELNEETTHKLLALSGKLHTTISVFIQTVWGVVVARYFDGTDIVFSTVVSCRSAEIENFERLVGIFMNTIPVRIKFDLSNKLTELIKKSQENAIACEPHHYFPLAKIQSDNKHKNELIDHIIVFENYPSFNNSKKKDNNKVINSELKLQNIEAHENSLYNIDISVIMDEKIKILSKYNNNLIDEKCINEIFSSFGNTLNKIIQNHDILIGEIDQPIYQELNSTCKLIKDFNF